MANQSYQSTWTGAIPGNQPQIPQNQNNQMMYNQPQPQNGPPVENMVKMTESFNANNSCIPLTSGDGLNERSPE